MSQQAMNWVLYHAPLDLDAVEFRLLTIIADNVDVEGRGFGKSVNKLMELYRAPVSERTVRAKLAHLQELGVLRLGDQRLVSYIPGNRRPKVYDIVMTTDRGAENAPLEEADHETTPTATTATDGENQSDDRGATGVQQGCDRGAAGLKQGCSMAAYKNTKSFKNTKNIKSLERVRARENETDPATRLLDLQPDDTHRKLAEQTHQNVEYELAKYQDACIANGRIPADPAAGFRNWLRRPAERGYQPATPPTPAEDPLDRRADRILETSTILQNLIPDPNLRADYKPAVRIALAKGMPAPEIVNMIAGAVRKTRTYTGATA